MDLSELMAQTLLLDLETTRTGKIRHIGAVFNGRVYEKAKNAGSMKILKELDRFAQSATYILGHNLLGHDFPVLKIAAPWLAFLKKPVIDTLYLSPLAFPQNPYHRLVKDYKLVRTAINSPVEDAKLAASVFEDQWKSFLSLAEQRPIAIDFYRFCFKDSMLNGFSGAGHAATFSNLTNGAIFNPEEALDRFFALAAGSVCQYAARQIVSDLLVAPEKRPAAAYTMAWLSVAGGNSVLPPWVRHRFPELPDIIKALREDPCGHSDCAYCTQNHDPERQLERFFGYPSFRETPKSSDGESLQRAIVNGC